ncbi:MAG: hypothetical protein NWF00_00580 [Candidatus Bathyarchaeota archaeon]|nr:hypothetical protein [Candidatus Bathyarchaeota archaeon]
MRFLLIVHVPTDAGNQMLQGGVKPLEDLIGQMKPEAAYFSEHYGERTFFLVVDVPSADAIPKVAEPLFRMGARVEFHIAMVLDDLKKAFQNAPKPQISTPI